MSSLLKNRVIQSNFTNTDYASIEAGLNSVTNHTDIMCQHIQKEVLPHINKGSFLDIGAGPGFIINNLLNHFNEIVALEPNGFYRSYYACSDALKKLTYVNKNFESASFEQKFDFILCSHVLYHIPQNKWSFIIQKILKLLSKKGIALLALVATRGQFHHLCNKINQKYSNSTVLRKILNKIKIESKVYKIRTFYFSKDSKEFASLLRMFVIDDCFLPEEYAYLPDFKIRAIEQRISEFMNSCYDHKKFFYALQIEEDYVKIHAEQPITSLKKKHKV